MVPAAFSTASVSIPILLKMIAKLVNQRDVEVALRVLDDLCGLGHTDAFGLIGTCGDNAGIKLINRVGYLIGVEPDVTLRISRRRWVLSPGLIRFGGVTRKEVFVEGQTRDALQNRHAVFFGGARVDCAFVDNDIAALQNACRGFLRP